MKRYNKLALRILIYSFAIFGLGMVVAWSAVKLKITNDPGGIDKNDRYFQEANSPNNQPDRPNPHFPVNHQKSGKLLERISELYSQYPTDTKRILKQFNETEDYLTVEKMLQAIELNLEDNGKTNAVTGTNRQSSSSVFYWMNLPEWPVLKEAVSKDQPVIDSVAEVTGIDSRLISSVLIAEQIRLFDSRREAFKKWIQPLKMLTSETSFSWGVTGIKDFTAIAIEKNLQDSTSVFYLGNQYRNLLRFTSEDHTTERFTRITNSRNHYYAYLYAALYIKQILRQWHLAGYAIGNRPEIIATLYNIGFANSVPKARPQVGGATIDVGGKNYTFGRIAWEYYYSGELDDVFPFPAAQK